MLLNDYLKKIWFPVYHDFFFLFENVIFKFFFKNYYDSVTGKNNGHIWKNAIMW